MELESEFMRTVIDRVPPLLILFCGAMAPVLVSEFVHIMSKWLWEVFRSLTCANVSIPYCENTQFQVESMLLKWYV